MTPLTRIVIIAALIYTVLMSFYFSLHHRVWIGIIGGVVAGIIFGLVMYWFVRSKLISGKKNNKS